MTAENRCPACDAELAANAPRGLCPACLLKGGLSTQTGGSNPSLAADFVPPTPAELTPLFPELEILELVGRGGMGVVYKARQKRLDRFVALKILSAEIGQDPAFAERFIREARAMGMLNHPHIVAVYDFGQAAAHRVPAESGQWGEGGLYYFLMEFVDGVNLRQLLDTGKLAPKEALAIIPQICEALQYAHDHGVVHRDIKPENVLLDKEGRVKIADFGIAKLVGRDASDLALTGAGQIVGTPQYMAPEQIEHPLAVDHRADIYSLGVVFYQMLTGELPIGRFAPPSKKVQIDVRLDEVVLRALEKEPELRYQHASEVKSRVETIVTTPEQLSATGSPTAPLTSVTKPLDFADFVGMLGGVVFTSPTAHKLANASALGFLGFLACLSYLPLPGMHRCSGFSGFFGFFGLTGFAFMVEFVQQRKAKQGAEPPRFGGATDMMIAAIRWTARIFALIVFLFFALFFVGERLAGAPALQYGKAQAAERIEWAGTFLMIMGLIVGWQWEGPAAICIVVGAMAFHIVEWKVFMGPLDLPLVAGLFFGLCWWMERQCQPSGSRALRGAFRGPMIRARNGQRCIYWPAVVQAALVIIGVSIAAQLPAAVLLGGKYHVAITVPVVVAGLGLLTFSVYRGLAVPLDRLARMDEEFPRRPAGGSDATIADQHRLVQQQRAVHGPAVGLIVTSLVNWLTIFFLLPGFVLPMRPELPPRMPLDIFFLVVAILALGSAVILIGALEMQSLASLAWARAASIAAMLIGPGYMIGWPVGIWSLVVLARPEVVAAFRKREGSVPQKGVAGWMKKMLRTVLFALGIAIVVRLFVLENILATTNAVAPDVPQGSYALVFKLARSYSPGDIAVYRNNGITLLGRVVEAGPKDGTLLIQRRNEAVQRITDASLIGKVILNTRHEHGSDNGPVPLNPAASASSPSVATLPALRDPESLATRTVRSNSMASLLLSNDMRTIVLAALEYSTEHGGWPQTLDELKPKYLDAGKIDLGKFIYYPMSGESLAKNPQEVAVLTEKVPASADGQLVGFADGYVEFISDSERLKQLFPAETRAASSPGR